MSNDKDEVRLPLILWSGGLDSTYLLYNELLTGDVDVLEVSLRNTFDHHSEAEKQAREKIKKYLAELHAEGHLKGKIRESLCVDFSYPMAKQQGGFHFGQQPAWLFVAYCNHDPLKHFAVLSGIVLSDSIVISVDAMKRSWNELREISPYLSQKRYWGKLPITELEFPLLYSCQGKKKVWDSFFTGHMKEFWEELRGMSWSCYRPRCVERDGVSHYEPCFKCDSCKDRAVVDPVYRTGCEHGHSFYKETICDDPEKLPTTD